MSSTTNEFDSVDLLDIIITIAEEICLILTSLVQQERAQETEGHRDNEKEEEQTDLEISLTIVVYKLEGKNCVSFEIVTSGSMWDKDMDEGHPTPQVGGQGGMITLPDGSLVPSEAIPGAYGNEAPDEYAENGSPVWKSNSMTMLKTLIPSLISEGIQNSSDKVGERISPIIADMIQKGANSNG